MDDYLSLLHQRNIDAHTFRFDSNGTIVAPDESSEFSEVPRTMSDLTLGEMIGEGGMGIVREALQPALGRRVALKTVHPDKDTPARRNDVFREAWVSARVEHPNVVPVYALDADEVGRPAFTMRFVEGTTWQAVLNAPDTFPELTSGKPPLDLGLDILDAVCRALHAAHIRGVLHRDVKPENVLLGMYGEVYLMDWGLAVALDPDAPGPLYAARDLTVVEGTPGFMSPEMAAAEGERIGVPSDVFALGATLHRLLTGERRFFGHNYVQVLMATYVCTPYVYGDDIDPGLAEVATRACAANPADRYPSVEAFRLALTTVRGKRMARALRARALQSLEDVPHGRHGNPIERARQLTSAKRSVEDALAIDPDDVVSQETLARIEILLDGLSSLQDALVESERQSNMVPVVQTRNAKLIPFGLFMSAVPLGVAIWESTGSTVSLTLIAGLVTGGSMVPLALRLADPSDSTEAMNRDIVAVMGTLFVSVSVLWFSVIQGRTMAECLAAWTIASFGAFAVMAHGRPSVLLQGFGVALAAATLMSWFPVHALWIWAAYTPVVSVLAYRTGTPLLRANDA